MGRVVDRSRTLIAAVDTGHVPDERALSATLDNHGRRAIYAERSGALVFAAVLIFVIDCLPIGLDHASGDHLTRLSISFTIGWMALLCRGAASNSDRMPTVGAPDRRRNHARLANG